MNATHVQRVRSLAAPVRKRIPSDDCRRFLTGAASRPTKYRGLLLIGIAIVAAHSAANAQGRDRYSGVRARMVDQSIAAEGVTDERVLAAMRSVPRHEFVRPTERHLAYLDQALDIGYKQTISPPFIVAYMTQMLDPQPGDTVLEIGTGSGYQAAVLAELVEQVYSIEIVEPLGKRAARTLKSLRYKNVEVKLGDGYRGWPEHAPFDKIIVTCSPEDVPKLLVEQLAEGGKMIIPLGERYQQVFHLLEKRDGKLVETMLMPTLFVPMTGRSEELRDVKPNPAEPQLVNGGLEELIDDTDLLRGWHYQRRMAIRTDPAPQGEQYVCFSNSTPGQTAHMLQGLAVDGSQVPKLRVSVAIQSDGIRLGRGGPGPALIVHFYDDRRRPIGEAVMGPWISDVTDWRRFEKTIAVPSSAREAIVQVGLNGASGTLCVDDVRLSPVSLN